MTYPMYNFLASLEPFSYLPESELKTTSELLDTSHYFAGMTLFVQNMTRMNHFYIVMEGLLEQYVLEEGEKRLSTTLSDHDTYGGISLLFNQGISLHMVQTLEDTIVYCLDAKKFLDLCSNYRDFATYFVDSFRQMTEEVGFLGHFAKRAAQSGHMELDSISRPIKEIYSQGFAECTPATPVAEAARIMTEQNKGYILVRESRKHYKGIITDADMRAKVICAGAEHNVSASQIMSAPIRTVSVNEDLLKAMTILLRYDIARLGVLDESGEQLLGVITEKDLLRAQMGTSLQVLNDIRSAETVQGLAHQHRQLPHLVNSLLDSGARAHNLNRLITSFNEIVLEKLMHFAMQELGPPPVRFAFLLMGSEGRQEQTLKTDQDNAIVFEDVPKKDLEDVRKYFLDLGTRVCDWLNEVGQKYCEFDIMAKNPTWCQPLTTWKEYHRKWVESDDPQGLLHATIFFDFRLGYGQEALVRSLHQSLFQRLKKWPGFLQHMARIATQTKPPLSFFGKFILDETNERKGGFDIKSSMRLVVDFARIYSLQEGITETNTIQRLQALHQLNKLDGENLNDLVHAYEYLMYQRLKHQAKTMIKQGLPPNNYLLPHKLTHIEQQSLKESFKRISAAQSKLRLDFFLHLS